MHATIIIHNSVTVFISNKTKATKIKQFNFKNKIHFHIICKRNFNFFIILETAFTIFLLTNDTNSSTNFFKEDLLICHNFHQKNKQRTNVKIKIYKNIGQRIKHHLQNFKEQIVSNLNL